MTVRECEIALKNSRDEANTKVEGLEKDKGVLRDQIESIRREFELVTKDNNQVFIFSRFFFVFVIPMIDVIGCLMPLVDCGAARQGVGG